MQIKEMTIEKGEFVLDGLRLRMDEGKLTVTSTITIPEKNKERENSEEINKLSVELREEWEAINKLSLELMGIVDLIKEQNEILQAMEIKPRLQVKVPPKASPPVALETLSKNIDTWKEEQKQKTQKKEEKTSILQGQIQLNIAKYLARQSGPIDFPTATGAHLSEERNELAKKTFEIAGTKAAPKIRKALKSLEEKGIVKLTIGKFRNKQFELIRKETPQKLQKIKSVYVEEDPSKEPTKDELETRILSFFQQKDYPVVIDWENEWYRELCKTAGTNTRWRIEATLESLFRMNLLEKERKNGCFQYQYKNLKNAETPVSV